MVTSTHFHNFAPADAVQYDGTQQSGSLAIEWLRSDRDHIYNFYRYARDARLEAFVIEENGDVYLCPGQWLVRQGSRVWVQDEEPARVERWDEGDFMACPDIDACEASTDSSPPTCDHGTVQERRPVLSNGWTGPWVPVAGGAE